MINKTEKDIMLSWQSDEMMVSITCVAFNHENYIHTTLDSFLMQETIFPFEILINDDVSMDKTVEILKEYQSKFPNIVKPVYQTENQHSQGINTMAILFPYIKGKYVAFCDGDDYWIDKEKLQIQVEEMEKHSELDFCFHPCYKDIAGNRTEVMAKHANQNEVFSVEHSILGHGDFAETASLMFTSSLIFSLPKWIETAMPGDYVTEVMGAKRGGSLYIDRIMSVYRAGLNDGWTEGELKKSTEEKRAFLDNIDKQLDLLDEYLEKKYHKEFRQVYHNDIFDFITTVDNDIRIKKETYIQYKNNFSLVEKLKWHLLFKHQNIIRLLKAIKDKKKISKTSETH